MIIGIDARLYGPVGIGGIGRYLEKLIQNLNVIDSKNEYVIFLRSDSYKEVNFKNSRFRKVLARSRWYTLTEQIEMPRLIWREKIDLMHFPHFNVPIFCPAKFVVTIHDLILINFPTARTTTLSPLKYKIKNLGYRFVIKWAVWKAERIITISEFTKEEIIKEFSVDPRRIKVIYEGVIKSDKKDDKNVLIKYNIDEPYLLYVGNAYPHKNLEGLLFVFKKIVESENLQLVIVGADDYFYKHLKKETEKLKLWGLGEKKDKVIFPGYVSDEELHGLYNRAFLYVSPSFYEGFGLPPLEAMAHGIPVISSRAASLSEILGEGALYFDPGNFEEMAEAIKKGLKDKKLREKLIAEGLKQIKKYSWRECARETLGVYEKI